MLNAKDIAKLTPFLAEKSVVNLEIKDRGHKGREVLLEYDDGQKLVGNLDEAKLKMQELTGLTSIVSYFARGKYGSNTWRGNCSGLLIMDIFGSLEQVMIKTQHNCFTDTVKYSGKFIPIEHEYLVIIRKGDPYIIPVSHVSTTQCDMRASKKSTWASVVAMILESHGGVMVKDELAAEMGRCPKAAGNNFIKAKLRQVVNTHPKTFRREGNRIALATPAAA